MRHLVFVQAIGGARGNPPLAGGGVWHIVSLAQEYRRRGVKVTLITNTHDTLPNVEHQAFDVVLRVPSIGSSSDQLGPVALFSLASQLRALRRLALNLTESGTLFVSVSPFVNDILATILVSHRSRSPRAFMLHHVTPPPWWFPFRRGGIVRCTAWWMQQAFVLALAKLAASAVMINETQLQKLEGICPGLRAIPDFGLLPPVLAGEVDGYQGDQSERWDACYVGRISPSKGLSDLLSVWAKLANGKTRPRLALLISTTSETQLAKLASSIARRRITGLVSIMPNFTNARKRAVMSKSRALVLPSYEEGWSLTAMEAANMGVPIICYDLPAYDYLRDWCITVPVGDRTQLRSTIEALIREPIRPVNGTGAGRRKRLSTTLEQYNASALVDQQLAVLDGI